jgi:hypothetical protein
MYGVWDVREYHRDRYIDERYRLLTYVSTVLPYALLRAPLAAKL